MSQPERTYIDPEVNMETEAYWEGTKQGKLLLKKCNPCGKTHYYPRAVCPHCFSGDGSWYEASGKGKIYTYSVMRRAEIPYAIAYIALDEGVTMLSNLVECDFDALSVGQDVEVVFRDTEGGQVLPMFRPA